MAQALATPFLAKVPAACSLATPFHVKGQQNVAKVPAALACRAAVDKEGGAPAGPGRRDALLSLAVTASALALPQVPLLRPEPALAADIVQRAQRSAFQDKLKRALAPAVEANQELIPSLLRLAINDALTYDKETKTGGANGSIRFAEELERPENKGLAPALELLEKVKADVDADAKGGPVSYADLIQFGGSAALKRVFINYAVEKAGGDYKKGVDLYRAIGSAGQWGAFDKRFGRADAAGPDPAGRVPVFSETGPAQLTELFAPFGLKPRQITVLAIFFSDDLNAYEEKLALDPEFLPWVDKYRKSRKTTSQTDYQVDLIGAFSTFSTLGAPINTEAYTFVPPRVQLRF